MLPVALAVAVAAAVSDAMRGIARGGWVARRSGVGSGWALRALAMSS
jgi:hypothetical protein